MDSNTTLHDLPSPAPPLPPDGQAGFEELSPAEVLDELQSPSLTDSRRRLLILMAELLRFEAVQEELFKPLLRKYVDRHASINPLSDRRRLPGRGGARTS